MKKCCLLFSLLLILLADMHAQKVGLVLSGGGAKGMTHIGIIRALEENGIPIDYITGTSMGAIVGSMYAMGYTPDEMEALIASPEFKRWYSGEVETQYEYYFKKNRPTPAFFNFYFSLNDTLENKKTQFSLPTNVVNPIQMNLVFLQLFSQATAACNGYFNNLFVPFRCVASDIYNKHELVLDKGDLGDAVRASMSFPFVFKPIEINGTLAYDGGIYNNFPADVMRKDFHPDIIIGSVVSTNPSKPTEGDLMSQIENMVMQKTNYEIAENDGILMTFKYDDVNLMDFNRLKELQQIGYDKTISLMDSIKGRISRRVTPESLRFRRTMYREKLPPLLFRDIYITGANEEQQVYIRKEFHDENSKIFNLEDLKRGYFRLLADNMISEIIPHAVYNKDDELFELHMNVKIEDNFSVSLGGNISTTSSNQLYLRMGYQSLDYYSKELSLEGQLGKMYNNLQVMGRLDLPTGIPFSCRLIGSISTFDYYKKESLFSKYNNPTFNSKNEQFIKLILSLPFMTNKKAELSFGVGRLKDEYFQSNLIDFDKDKPDQSLYKLLGGSIGYYGSTLNSRQYATAGYYEQLVAQIYTGDESFTSGNKSTIHTYHNRKHTWLQISFSKDTYHRISNRFTLGWQAEALYSSKNFSDNYTATMMQAGSFSPTPHSKLIYNKAFRANQYLAAGIKPIYTFSDILHLRTEFYGFLPIYPIKCNEHDKPYYGKAFTGFQYIGEVSLVCKLPFGAVSAYVNHYSSPRREWNVGICLGWQIFNYRFIE